MTEPTRIRVGGERPYDVVVGTGLLGEIAPMLGHAQRVAVVHPRALRVTAEAVKDDLAAAGFEALIVEVPDGEDAKTAAVAEFVWSVLGQAGFTRTDAVVGLGGGATTDLAGFVAATWLRGVPVVHVPTTLLAMVDAAVGGKTAINTDAGKNLVGAFHPPAGVVCDLASLVTLPKHDYVSGLAEVIKTGFIADPVILDRIEADPAAAIDPAAAVTRELVERSIRVKAEVVAADLTEQGGREVLNYGHTLGHAIEKVEKYTWRHGAAVAIGLVYAAELARLTKGLPDDVVDRHRSVLRAVGLPIAYRGDRWHQLHEAMKVDKKSRGSRLRFIVLDDLAKTSVLDDPDPSLVVAAYTAITDQGES